MPGRPPLPVAGFQPLLHNAAGSASASCLTCMARCPVTGSQAVNALPESPANFTALSAFWHLLQMLGPF